MQPKQWPMLSSLKNLGPEVVACVVHGIRKRADGRPVISVAGGVNAQNAGHKMLAAMRKQGRMACYAGAALRAALGHSGLLNPL